MSQIKLVILSKAVVARHIYFNTIQLYQERYGNHSALNNLSFGSYYLSKDGFQNQLVVISNRHLNRLFIKLNHAVNWSEEPYGV